MKKISNKIEEIVKKRLQNIIFDLKYYEKIKNLEININNREKLSENIEKNNGISIISEIKPASPSLGKIRENIKVAQVVREMEKAGVIGISILTEPHFFNGSYENLKITAIETNLSCLMKDFIIHPIQIKIAEKLNASNVLLINSICDLPKFLPECLDLGLEPLIEIHTKEEIDDIGYIIDEGFEINLIGVNNRDLKTLKIDISTSEKIIPELKERFGNNIKVISESGIDSYNIIKKLTEFGADGFLIGTAIMKSENIKEKILSLRGLK
ncbi:MAG: indole-3-glycerol-phosphate synthase [Promethearchaeota archaeon]